MLWFKTIKVAISAPTPNEKFGLWGLWLRKTWRIKIVVPKDLHVSPVFVTGIYEDLANHVGIKVGENNGR